MEQGGFNTEGRADTPAPAPTPPTWLRQATQIAPDRRRWMLEHMARHKFVAVRPARGTAESSDPPRAIVFLAKFILYMVFFGFIGALASSLFPICLGLLLFFTADDFIEWVLETTGIRLVPHAPGPDFIRFFVFTFGWGLLLGSWRDSAPAWLLPWLPPSAPWPFVARAALLIAAAAAVAAAIAGFVAPRSRDGSADDGLGRITAKFLIGLGVLALLAGLDYSTSMVSAWLEGH
ncbi:hypothetical protein JQ596_23245 [Bradyrhizobium manausense]|uniref:hypothetical protein n=1 Tax=Bradyrhizobium TaxID=374 RepID=UPI001BA79A18|nr:MULTISPECIES: hypothetical protein [Bradyrhizobium]MBR0828458.1 hypothetical protein [Bradyrhizobium manausense]UVO25481.1 hypothetical protein KUF59_23060 [Bradyrhizobium arachidis]